MVSLDYNSPAALADYLEQNGFAMRKKFGQNFLINPRARTRLIDALEAAENMNVWEIGPGLGAETRELLERGYKVTAFEIDKGFCQILRALFDNGDFLLVEGDALKTWRAQLEKNGGVLPPRLFGNLPYNIAAALIADFIERGAIFDAAVVTVQKEIAQRMLAKPGSSAYSSFSALCSWAYGAELVMDLAPGSFWPRPRVQSCAVKLTRRADYPRCADKKLFTALLRALFASRRKTVKNNLEAFLRRRGDFPNADAETVLRSRRIAPNSRAEELSVETFLELSDALAGLRAKTAASSSAR